MIVYPLVGSLTRRDMEVRKLLILQFTIIGSSLLLSEGRLLEKSPDKVKTTPEPDLVQSTIFKRVARKVLYKLKDFSKEDEASNEVSKRNGQKIRYESNTNGPTRIQAQRFRITRQSVDLDHHYIAYDKRESVPDNNKPKKVFIKKPIPKFYELNYENDFQNNIDKFPGKLMDSVAEHEDEDFNVDDYDFDVNHDEFVGRGKPLEPRLKKIEDKVLGEIQKQEEKAKEKPLIVPSVAVVPSTKIVITPQPKQKREYPAIVPYKPSLKKEDDYSNEFPSSSSTDKTPNNRAYDDDDDDDDDDDADDADENLDKESSHKVRATRTVSNKSFYNAPVEKKSLVTPAQDVPVFTHLNALSDPNDFSLEDYHTWNANSQNSDSMAYF